MPVQLRRCLTHARRPRCRCRQRHPKCRPQGAQTTKGQVAGLLPAGLAAAPHGCSLTRQRQQQREELCQSSSGAD